MIEYNDISGNSLSQVISLFYTKINPINSINPPNPIDPSGNIYWYGLYFYNYIGLNYHINKLSLFEWDYNLIQNGTLTNINSILSNLYLILIENDVNLKPLSLPVINNDFYPNSFELTGLEFRILELLTD